MGGEGSSDVSFGSVDHGSSSIIVSDKLDLTPDDFIGTVFIISFGEGAVLGGVGGSTEA